MIRRLLLLGLFSAALASAKSPNTDKPDSSDKPKAAAHGTPAKPAPKPAPKPPQPQPPGPAPVPVPEVAEGPIPAPPPTPTLGPAGVPQAPLPKWEEPDLLAVQTGKWIPGSLLLTDEMPPDEANPGKPEPLKIDGPTPEEIAGDQSPSSEIPDKYLAAYFTERPKAFLVDPQHLLTPQQYRDQLAFLDSHAAESSIDLFVYVFAASQELPGEVRAEELAERLFATGRPAAFVYYFIGAPQRSVFYLSPSLTDTVSGAEQRRALQSSVSKALEKTDMVGQLEAFCVQMAIRLYWLERILSGNSVAETLQPVDSPPPKPPEAPGKVAALLKKLPDRWWVPVAVLLGAAVSGFGVRLWLRLRMRYRLPEFDVEPRLGGAHAAGIGAVISFASASLPPAVQREQVPDYLRRA